jgi:GNAT superfamily N-acetyltransferase
MSGPAVRPATSDDSALLLDLIRGLAEYERLAPQVTATEDAIRETLFGPHPAAEALIGEIDGRPAGYAPFFGTYSTFLARPGVYLEDLFVLPGARGRGLGIALFSAVAQIAVERGSGRLEWSVLDWNEPALGFYRALGAEPMDGWTVHRLTGDALSALAARGRRSS